MRRALCLGLMMALITSCATTGGPRAARYPNAVTPEAQSTFDAAERTYRAARFTEADAQLAAFVETFPYTELTDRARFLRGEIAFAQGRDEAAIALYRSAYAQIDSPFVAPRAQYKEALALFRQKRCGPALDRLRGITRVWASATLRMRIDALGVYANRCAGGDERAAIVWYLGLLDDSAEGGESDALVSGEERVSEEEALEAVRRWIDDGTVTLASVRALPLEAMRGKRSGGYADYKLAVLLHTGGMSAEAATRIKAYLTTYPKHEFYGAARLLASELGGEFGEGASVAVGAILPLSGRYAVYGESVLHGMECAVGVFTPCSGPAGMTIHVRDSGGHADRATRAVEELAEIDDLVAIVGPLMSHTAPAAARRAQELGIPLITLTQQQGVVEVGDFVFRNSVSPDSEVEAIVDYAIGQKRLKRFFVLYPDNRKGSQYEALFSERVRDAGGEVVARHAYAPNQMEFASELRGEGSKEGSIDATGAGVHYDAVFIPDSFRVVGYIAPTLALMGVTDVQLLGISRWDDPRLVERGGEFVEGALFVDSFYRKAPNVKVSGFVAQFRDAYGIEPTLLEALGFDATQAVIVGAQRMGAFRRESMRDALAGMRGLGGVSGLMGFDAVGDAQRRFVLLTVTEGAIVPVK